MAQIFQPLLLGPLVSRGGGQTFINLTNRPNQEDLMFVKGLVEAGRVKPVIDKCYPLDQGIEAVGYYGLGYSREKVVIVH